MTSISFKQSQSDAEIQQLVSFLTTSVVFQGTGDYFTVFGPLPLSYYSTADYWGGYVCGQWAGQNGQNCSVNDQDFALNQPNYYRNGGDSPGTQLQLERIDATLGTDIYDAACWQIALALVANRNLSGIDPNNLFSLVANSTHRLTADYNKNPDPIRATNASFQYGYQSGIADPKEAYALRLIGKDFMASDILWNHPVYGHYVTFDSSINSYVGCVTWPDWKPITGENGWAFLIGPLQADYLQYYPKQGYIPFNSESIQNAIYVLYAFQQMQSPIGAFYYAPGGSDGNTGAIPKGQISIENNASCLAGLMILKQALEDILNKDSSLLGDELDKLKVALNLIAIMIWGGTSPSGGTDGLLRFFQTKAWNSAEGVFYTDGTYDSYIWKANGNPKAVDVDTWGLTVLGPQNLDSWFGAGTAFTLWQNVKQWGSFSQNNQLWGVGYCDQDNHSIMSAEWTAGAINAVRCLMVYYQNDATKFASLQSDHDSMMVNLLNLRTDKYVSAGFPNGLDAQSFNYVNPPSGQLAFLYASKRYNIPFGWYSNPIPSTTSTSWTIYLHYDYNPFQLGGAYTSLDWTPPNYDPTNGEGPWNITEVTVTVQNYATVPLKVVQNQQPLADLPSSVNNTPTDTVVTVDSTVDLYILDPSNWSLVCKVAAGTLKEGDFVANNLSWGGSCHVVTPGKVAITVQNYATVPLKVVQNQQQLADLLAGSETRPTSTNVTIDNTIDLYILDPNGWSLVCKVPAGSLKQGSIVQNNLSWGGNCNIQ